MSYFEKFKEPFTKYISNLDINIIFIGVCKEKSIFWAQRETEEGIIDLLIPSSYIIPNNEKEDS